MTLRESLQFGRHSKLQPRRYTTTRIAYPDTMDPTNVDNYWPDNAPTGIVCGSQPDGDGECRNEVTKGSLCEACKEYNENHA